MNVALLLPTVPPPPPLPLLLVHLAATWFMVGLIWFVQVVHYPLFRAVGIERWLEYERLHQRRTTGVVLPVMLVELITAVLLVIAGGTDAVPRWMPWLGLALLAMVWISTFCLQVPLHRRLSERHEPRQMCLLVRTNWIRTAAWTARGALAAAMMVAP